MNRREKIGQLFSVWCYGGFLSTDSAEYKDLLSDVEEKHVGALLLATQSGPLGWNAARCTPRRCWLTSCKATPRFRCCWLADFERGTGMRNRRRHVVCAADGRGGDTAPGRCLHGGKDYSARSAGRRRALDLCARCRRQQHPDNPIINTRSFGKTPRGSPNSFAAFVRGVEENGGLATAKHFPGHGDTNVDSHLDLPSIPRRPRAPGPA